ncbi:MAG TPA: DUF4157 domain-containing protein [Acidimicrobiales bacterium]|nr:DUF4157 domain-containing protein [Acidimicrobiales bacterium]
MVWPFRRRSEPPATTPAEPPAPTPPERRQEWAALAPLGGSVPSHPLTIERESFEGELAALTPPELRLAPLRHAVSEDAPAGVIEDLVTAVDAAPGSLPALPSMSMPLVHPAPPAPVVTPARRPLPSLRVAPAAPAPVQRAMVSAPPPVEPPRPLPLAEPLPVVPMPVSEPDPAPVLAPVPVEPWALAPPLPGEPPPAAVVERPTTPDEAPLAIDAPLVLDAPTAAAPPPVLFPESAPERAFGEKNAGAGAGAGAGVGAGRDGEPALPLATPPAPRPPDEHAAADVPILGDADPMPRRLGLGEPIRPDPEPQQPQAFAPPAKAAAPMPLPPAESRMPKAGPAPKGAVTPTRAPAPAAPTVASVQRAPLSPSTAAPAPAPPTPSPKPSTSLPLLSSRPPALTVTEQVPAAVRAHVERTVGTDLGDVRVHRGEESAHHAAALDARAFTSDGEVHLPAAHGPLDHGPAQALLAHELVHVAQQKRMGATRPAEHTATGRQLEHEARAVEHQVARQVEGHNTPPAAPPLPLPRPAGRPTSPDTRPFLDPGQVALDAGIATRAPDGSVLFTAPPAGAPQPPPPQRAVTVETSDSPPGVEATPVNVDVLYDKIRRRLKDELRLNRQRLGMNMDFGR